MIVRLYAYFSVSGDFESYFDGIRFQFGSRAVSPEETKNLLIWWCLTVHMQMTREEIDACNCDKEQKKSKTKKLPHTDLVMWNTNLYHVPIFG